VVYQEETEVQEEVEDYQLQVQEDLETHQAQHLVKEIMVVLELMVLQIIHLVVEVVLVQLEEMHLAVCNRWCWRCRYCFFNNWFFNLCKSRRRWW
jgi:hypothetical protein